MNDDRDLVSLFKTLAHEGRIRVAAAIISRSRSVDDVASEIGIPRREAAAQFEPERMYDEREINAVLREYHPDVASLRRYLVDGGFLRRQFIRSIPADALGSENPPVEPRVQYWKPRAPQ